MKWTLENVMILILLVFWFSGMGAVSCYIYKWLWDNVLSGWHFDNWIPIDHVIFWFGNITYYAFWFLIAIFVPWQVHFRLFKEKTKVQQTHVISNV